MLFPPCLPTPRAKVPDRPEWIYEIKHDGYRLIVYRDGKRVRLFTSNGHDWTTRYPRMVAAALRNRNSSFVIDRERCCWTSTAAAILAQARCSHVRN